jgi:hypothetical protein
MMSSDLPPWNHTIPAVRAKDLADARLYADRLDLIQAVGPKKADVVIELGVALGDFSKELIRRFRPTFFYAADRFDLDKEELLWGKASSAIFNGNGHLNTYLSRLAGESCVKILQGDAAATIGGLGKEVADVIYVDASHHYADVKRDADAASAVLKKSGVLIFNDYVLWSCTEKMWYGVVPVVNDLIVNKGWKVIGLSLHPEMFCDIALAPPDFCGSIY